MRLERVCILIMGLAIVCELVWSGLQQRSIDDLGRTDRETGKILDAQSKRIGANWKDLRGEAGLCIRFPHGSTDAWIDPQNGQALPSLYAEGKEPVSEQIAEARDDSRGGEE